MLPRISCLGRADLPFLVINVIQNDYLANDLSIRAIVPSAQNLLLRVCGHVNTGYYITEEGLTKRRSLGSPHRGTYKDY